MNGIKLSISQITLSFVVTLALIAVYCNTPLPSGSTQVRAESATPPLPSGRGALGQPQGQAGTGPFVPPPLPPRGAPGQRQGETGRRSELCRNVETPLTALVPIYETSGENSVWGLTVAEHPTFWFYVPYSLTPDLAVEFRLQEEENWQNDKYVYKTTFTAETAPGVISLRLPSQVALQVGKRYRWSLVVHCFLQDNSANIVVNGWIERIAPSENLIKQLKTATPREDFALYAANGIWYDALTTLSELRRVSPQDALLKHEWTALLQDVNLNDITSKPIAQCCTLEQ